MMNQDDENLIREAVKEWEQGTLTAFAAMVVIHSILNPATPSKEDIEWTKDLLLNNIGP